jgi:sugar phosphate isomerase/epimerase
MSPNILGIGVNTQSATANPQALARTIERIAGFGCSHAEISLSRAFAIAGGKPIPSQVQALKQACRDGGLKYTVHAPLRVNFYDTENLRIQERVVRASIDIAAEIGATLVNVHCGYATPEVFRRERESLLSREREILAALAGHASAAGVTLAVENTFPEEITGDVPDLATLAEQIRAVGSESVCGCLDVSHASLMSAITGGELLTDIREFSPVVGHFHLNDCFATPRPQRLMPPSDYLAFGWGDLHLPLGWGTVDWKAVAGALSVSRAAVLILEISEPFWESALADSVEQARAIGEAIAHHRPA